VVDIGEGPPEIVASKQSLASPIVQFWFWACHQSRSDRWKMGLATCWTVPQASQDIASLTRSSFQLPDPCQLTLGAATKCIPPCGHQNMSLHPGMVKRLRSPRRPIDAPWEFPLDRAGVCRGVWSTTLYVRILSIIFGGVSGVARLSRSMLCSNPPALFMRPRDNH
jgi:hypothetical protein